MCMGMGISADPEGRVAVHVGAVKYLRVLDAEARVCAALEHLLVGVECEAVGTVTNGMRGHLFRD